MHGGSPEKTEVPLTLGKSAPLALGGAVLVFPQSHREQGRHRFHGYWPLSLLYLPITSTRPSLRVQLPCVVLAAVTELLALPYFAKLPMVEGVHRSALLPVAEGHTLEHPVPLSSTLAWVQEGPG